jgi:hypothetical protein
MDRKNDSLDSRSGMGHPPGSTPNTSFLYILRDFGKGVIAILLVMGLKVASEHTFAGEEIEQTAYRWIQTDLGYNLNSENI